MEFHRFTGIASHAFEVRLPYSFATAAFSSAGRFCVGVMDGNQVVEVEVRRSSHPDLFEALILVGGVDGETAREKRYIDLYSAYEALVKHRDPDVAAVRHALAHAPHALGSPVVVQSLTRRFGGPKINFRDRAHRKEFFRSLAHLIIAVDHVLASRLRTCSAG